MVRLDIVLPSEGGYQNNAACVGGGTLSYGAQAWRYHAAGLSDAFHLRRARGQFARRLAHLLRRSGALLRQGRVRDRHLRRLLRHARFIGPRKRPLPMPPLPPNREFEILEPAAKRLGLHPFHIPMARNSVPYNGRGPCMRCRWCCRICLRSGCQERLAEHRDSHGAGDRQLRTAHRVHGEGDSDRRPRPRHAALPTSTRTDICRSSRPTSSLSPRAPSSRRACCSIQRAACFRMASEIATTRSAAICRAITTPAPSVSSTSTPTTMWAPARASPLPTTTTALRAFAAGACWPTSSSDCRFK